MNRIFSGLQPTGNIHLGNYLGAVRNWVNLQSDYECIYCIVDLHAITVAQDPAALRKSIMETTATYIACGLDPKQSIIFNQSTVSAHAELAWIMSCHTTIGKLNRMTQFKDKAGKNKEKASLGLYSYPVLMAADILAYKATHVPVGDDQKQHLELTRDIASVFNESAAKEFFPLPETLILGGATRVMSLRDGTKKMSKSEESDMSRINLMDDADLITKKLKKAKSDMIEGISYDIAERPEVSNLLTIYSAVTEQSIEAATQECAAMNMATLKQTIADALIAHLAPIQQRYTELMVEPSYISDILTDGAARADAIARPIMNDVKDVMGFYLPNGSGS